MWSFVVTVVRMLCLGIVRMNCGEFFVVTGMNVSLWFE